MPEEPAVTDDTAWCGSTPGGGIEVAPLRDGGFAVRHAWHRDGPVLVYTRDEMTAFLLGAKDGDFDDLLERA